MTQLRDVEGGRNGLPATVHQLVIQYPMISPQNMHVGSTLQTEKFVSMNMCAYMCVCITMDEKRSHALERDLEEVHRTVWRQEWGMGQ